MVVTEWYELRGGFIEGDVIKWREFIRVPKGPRGRRRKGLYTGEGYGGQKLIRVGQRSISAEVIQGPDEEGWVYLLVRQYDNLGMTDVGKILNPPPVKVGTKIKRHYKTIMNGEPRRLLWSNEDFRSKLTSNFLGEKEHSAWMDMDMDDEE